VDDYEQSLNLYPSPAPGVLGRQIQNEAVIVLASQAKVKVLNEVGARIWALADGSRTVAEIATSLCAEYEVTEPEARADVLEFVNELVERQALRLMAEPHSPKPAG
jgi:hypothetical protein